MRPPRSFAVLRRWLAAIGVAAFALEAAADNDKVAHGINLVLSQAEGIYRTISGEMHVVLLYHRGNEKGAADLKRSIDAVVRDKQTNVSTVVVPLSGVDRYRSELQVAAQARPPNPRPSAFVAVDLWADAVADVERIAADRDILTISTKRIDVDQKKLSVAVLNRTHILKSSEHLRNEGVTHLNVGQEIRPDSRRDGPWIADYSEARIIARRPQKNASDWEQAARYYQQAIRLRSIEEKRSIPLDGVFSEVGYVPHFYLGVALVELKRYDAALAELLESERQGVIRTLDPALTKQLSDLKKLCIDRGAR